MWSWFVSCLLSSTSNVSTKPAMRLAALRTHRPERDTFVVDGEDFASMIENVNRVFEYFVVWNENGKNMMMKYQDYPDKYLFLDQIKDSEFSI